MGELAGQLPEIVEYSGFIGCPGTAYHPSVSYSFLKRCPKHWAKFRAISAKQKAT